MPATLRTMVKTLLATRELTVDINGVTYDVLLIPREKAVDIDYSKAPELHPLNKREEVKKDKG